MLKVLLACANIFESRRLVFINEIVRRTFGPIFLFTLRLYCGGTWIIRHSASEPGLYNAFFSDYDLALLIDDHWADSDVERTLGRFAFLKSFLIMLGEVEIYFLADWNEKQKLIEKHNDVVRQVRDLRKLKWMRDAYRKTNVPYHKAKALRSVMQCRRKIRKRRSSIQRTIENVFLGGPIPFETFYSEFFQKKVRFSLKKMDHLLMAMTTVDRCPYIGWSNMIQDIRLPAIRFEFLEHQAYQRQQQKKVRPQLEKLDDLKLKINEMLGCIDSDPTWLLRYRAHLDNNWILKQDFEEVRQQEEAIQKVYCHSADVTFQAWMKYNLPYVECIRKTEETFFSKEVAQNQQFLDSEVLLKEKTVSYLGPPSDRFGMDVFLQFVLFLEESGHQDLKIEFCVQQDSKEMIFKNPAYHAEFVKIRSKISFVEVPNGIILFFHRHNYPLERNWKKYWQALSKRSISSMDMQEVLKKLNFYWGAASAQELI